MGTVVASANNKNKWKVLPWRKSLMIHSPSLFPPRSFRSDARDTHGEIQFHLEFAQNIRRPSCFVNINSHWSDILTVASLRHNSCQDR
jgi:hypothetical protein